VADGLPGDWPASGSNDLRALSAARPAFATHSESADTLGRWACMFFFFSNGLGLMGSIVISILLTYYYYTRAAIDDPVLDSHTPHTTASKPHCCGIPAPASSSQRPAVG
jgi:hypothetical protein